jgi:hypothetical protein
MLATMPPEIIIGLRPRVLLKTIPLNAPATMLLAASCLPRVCPSAALTQLYTMATTPAEFPRNGPRLVTEFRTLLRRILGGAVTGARLRPSVMPHTPPSDSAERYVVPVP